MEYKVPYNLDNVIRSQIGNYTVGSQPFYYVSWFAKLFVLLILTAKFSKLQPCLIVFNYTQIEQSKHAYGGHELGYPLPKNII